VHYNVTVSLSAAAGGGGVAARGELGLHGEFAEVCHYITQPFVELYGGCMVVLKVS
jgi:hypothetical protein